MEDLGNPMGVLVYTLLAVVCHIGSASNGHYVTYVLDGENVVTLNDIAVTTSSASDRMTIERHYVLLLYQFVEIIPEDDGRMSIASSSGISDQKFQKKRNTRQEKRISRKQQQYSVVAERRGRKKGCDSSYKG